MNNILLELSGIRKIYYKGLENELEVLKGIDLTVHNGEFLAIVGRSGSGKSTLMNILGMLDLPSYGSYLFEGQNVFKASHKQLSQMRRKKIGFVFQNFELFPDIVAQKNIEMPMLYAGIKSRERTKRAKELLELVGLSDRANHLPSQLSGGQQQRVAIARALANEPQLILADEPTGALDSENGSRIINLLKEMSQSGKTIILITHDREVAECAQRRITLSDGKIVRED